MMLVDRFWRIYAPLRLLAGPALLATSLCVVLGMGLVVIDLYHSLHRDLRAMQVRTTQVFDRLDGVLATVLPLVKNAECRDVVDVLRSHAAFDHQVRSLALVNEEKVYCTSLFPDDEYRFDTVADRTAMVRLLHGTPQWPSSPALTIRRTEEGQGVLAFVSGRALVPLMPSLGPGTYVIHVGDLHLVNGAVRVQPEADSAMWRGSLPVRPGVSVERELSWDQVFEHLAGVWLWILGFSALLGLVVALFYGRAYQRGGILPNQLRLALARDQFVPYYHAVVSNAVDHPVVGFEVLMRWQKPGEGLIQPADFLPMAERTGLLVPMTEALMTRVIHDVNTCPELQGRALGINLTPQHLSHPDKVLALARRFLTETSPTGTRLTFEISERSIVSDLEACRGMADELRRLGVRLSVDDFGAANANVDTLCAINFDSVKCDRFISALVNCGDSREAIPATMVDLIHRLGFDIVIEGIESVEQVDYFCARGVHLLQGYYFSRPLPRQELAAWLEQHQKRFALDWTVLEAEEFLVPATAPAENPTA